LSVVSTKLMSKLVNFPPPGGGITVLRTRCSVACAATTAPKAQAPAAQAIPPVLLNLRFMVLSLLCSACIANHSDRMLRQTSAGQSDGSQVQPLEPAAVRSGCPCCNIRQPHSDLRRNRLPQGHAGTLRAGIVLVAAFMVFKLVETFITSGRCEAVFLSTSASPIARGGTLEVRSAGHVTRDPFVSGVATGTTRDFRLCTRPRRND
jgi:hypothetical protein